MTAAGRALARFAVVRAPGSRTLITADVVVAVLLSLGAIVAVDQLRYVAPAAVGWLSCLGCTVAVAFRRFAPFMTAVLAVVALVVYQAVTNDPDGSFIAPAVILVYYFAGRSAAERSAWKRLAALLGFAFIGNVIISAASGPFSLLDALGAWPIMVLPVMAGVVVARHASLIRQLAATTVQVRQEQQAHSDRLVGEERNRIARELHDVVAHHVSVMVIQAGAGRLVTATDSVAADLAMQVVERSGREALVDLRRVMGVMRRDDSPYPTAAMGLAHLDGLTERARVSGVPVEVHVSGRLDRVPTAVDLVAHRVVQEALTNVVKHAGPARARVAIDVGAQTLDITVTDDGSRGTSPALPESGHGLRGMRERVALYGGTLHSEFRPAGGFAVRVSLPLRDEPLTRPVSDDGRDSANQRDAGRAWRRLGALKPWSDRLLGIGWLIALEVDAVLDHYRRGPLVLNLAAVAVMGLAFAGRRRSPLLFTLVVGLAAIPLSSGLTSAHSTLTGFYCVTVPMFTLAAWEQRPRAVLGLALWIAGTIGSGILTHKPVAGVAGGLIMSCLLWAAGRLWRRQRQLARRLADTQVLLTAERKDREQLAIVSERARIARELHTLVAHGVVAMIVQAASARAALRSATDAALASMAAIEDTGRAALARMREILGVLRAPHTTTPVRPQPGLGQLHAMVAKRRENGQAVELRIEGEPGPLPAGVDLTTYRIIESALWEADRRPSRIIVVALRFLDDDIEVNLTGDGLQLPAELRLTIAERAALCNGTVLPPEPARGRTPQLRVRLPRGVSEMAAV